LENIVAYRPQNNPNNALALFAQKADEDIDMKINILSGRDDSDECQIPMINIGMLIEPSVTPSEVNLDIEIQRFINKFFINL
jgi:hypothetical protein